MPDASQVAMPFIATDAPSVPVTLSPSTAAVTMLVALLGARDSAVFTGKHRRAVDDGVPWTENRTPGVLPDGLAPAERR